MSDAADRPNALVGAIRLLTVIPVSSGSASIRPGLLYWFPVVGAIIGAGVLAAPVAIHRLNPAASPFLSAVLSVFCWCLLTRGFHLDGLADSADALGAMGDRSRRLDILKDPHVGAFGVTAIVLVLLTKTVAIASLIQSGIWVALLAAPAIARWIAVIACTAFSPARSDGLGAAFVGQAGLRHVTITSAMLALFLSALPQTCGAAGMILAAVIAGLGVSAICSRQFGGITGDVLGAAIEISETAALVFCACRP